jgi:hypothetical protein
MLKHVSSFHIIEELSPHVRMSLLAFKNRELNESRGSEDTPRPVV